MIFWSSGIFFFQAEDGIRDIGVTGVQTCALPISRKGIWVCPCSGRGRQKHAIKKKKRAPGKSAFNDFTLWRIPVARVKLDRKSVVLGQSVDLGGRRIIKKKNSHRTITNVYRVILG